MIGRSGMFIVMAVGLADGALAAETVSESARAIPVVQDVDVVVVGGSSAGVAAAAAAAQAGAKVFLLSPRPYLGEDLCATLRLWREPGDDAASPLADRIFSDPALGPSRRPDSLPLKYKASLASSPKHRDTAAGTVLTDGKYGTPNAESVQYDGDVAITADLGAAQPLREARILLYERAGEDFDVDRVAFATSLDGKEWRPVAELPNPPPDGELCVVSTTLTGTARYVRFDVRKAAGSTRILVGEIEVAGATPPAAEKPVDPALKLATPMHVKRTLDEALLAAKVGFLHGCYATEVLVDEAGTPSGIVMANRAGRQAVRAKVIIDATPRATVARLSGAAFTPYPAGAQTFKRVAIGGEACTGPELTSRELPVTFRSVAAKGAKPAPIREYTLRLPMDGATPQTFAEADQRSRDLLWHPLRLDLAEALFQVPPDAVRGAKADRTPWKDVGSLGLDALRPAAVKHVWVLGGCADVSREAAEKLLRPATFMALGERVGRAAAEEARGRAALGTLKVAGAAVPGPGTAGDVREFLGGVRPIQKDLATVASPTRALPVLGTYDVVVVGGGTGGSPAGIGASKSGARTLLIEYLHGLGGVGTQGRIIKYYHGYRGGFTAKVDEGIAALKCPNPVVAKSEYWRRANREAGTEIWFGCLGAGAYVVPGGAKGDTLKGVVVVTPFGRGVVLANTVIDSSGNSDVAAAAHAESDYTGAQEAAVQGTGLPPLGLDDDYTNTDWTFADDTDVVDIWHHYVVARQMYRNAFDLGQLVDTRERRRIVGDVTITPMDIILERTWPDTLNIAKSNFDTHGFTVHPIFFTMPPDRQGLAANVPLRALMPRGLDGVLVTGLGVSAHRDAMPVIRMQADVQNQGYACGHAAALAAKANTTIRGLDVRRIQSHLVEMGILPTDALTTGDPKPPTPEQLQAAVDCLVLPRADDKETPDGVIKDRHALAMLFASPEPSRPLLEKAHAVAQGEAKDAYALTLAFLGSPAGADTLVRRVKGASVLDAGWNYKGMGQFGRSVSELDAFIIALGRVKDPRATEVVLEKVALLDAAKEFSHHRACAMALETLRDPRAAKPLADLLAKPGLRGHAVTTLEASIARARGAANDNVVRNESLRELTLARALYRCGDHQGVGEAILREYAQDLRGHYARHATAVLAEKGTTAQR